ncbi:DoxX family protein [Terrilactibacillus laevilacticus]|uniref:DoxX family protein n=1 Tax=Terrilactibacillus laevilacticus TaxID=1380157 RepID=A0ABW5PM36_9BACI|nr:DoxX family protein [Terrilactibacillus laevilacticus]
MMNLGLLLIRLVMGLTFMGHGAQKVSYLFGGSGVNKTGESFESMGLKPGIPMAVLAALGELIGGGLFVLGLLTPVSAILIVVTMLVAIVKAHLSHGYWNAKNGFEYNLLIASVAIGVALIGPGEYALDALVF